MKQRQATRKIVTGKTSVTIKQVADQAGVSTATVSRVLAEGGRGVRQELRERVQKAALKLDYQPNHIARNLRVQQARLVGVIIPDIQNFFFTGVVRGIEDVLQQAGYTLLIGSSDGNPVREQLYLRTFRAEGVAGIVFIPSSAGTQGFQQVLNYGLPLVAIDRTPGDLSVDLVTVQNTAGARAAINHLLEMGHRRIGLICGPAHLNVAQEREAGYVQAIKSFGLTVSPDLIKHADFRQAGGYQALLDLIDLPQPPTAVFVANNLMTLGTFQAIHERGLSIPSDIAVVGFDDMPWATSLHPPLTTVSQPTYELGNTAAELLLARLGEPERPTRHVVLDTKLMVRASCGAGSAKKHRQK